MFYVKMHFLRKASRVQHSGSPICIPKLARSNQMQCVTTKIEIVLEENKYRSQGFPRHFTSLRPCSVWSGLVYKMSNLNCRLSIIWIDLSERAFHISPRVANRDDFIPYKLPPPVHEMPSSDLSPPPSAAIVYGLYLDNA